MTAGSGAENSAGFTADRSRRESRERTVELAYEAAVRGLSVDEMLATLVLPAPPFTVELLRRSERHQPESDRLIEQRAAGWSLARMPILDLVIMRLAVAELIDGETPTGVVLSEAVELAGRYSTDESSRFVNGVLAAVAADLAEQRRGESPDSA